MRKRPGRWIFDLDQTLPLNRIRIRIIWLTKLPGSPSTSAELSPT